MTEPGSGERSAFSVPTDNAEAALQFCRDLARMMAEGVKVARASESLPHTPAPEISVVIPLFDEEENLPPLYRRLTDVLSGMKADYELILVNDGSRDRTPVLMEQFAAQDPRVVVIELARNFGHQAAISAGLEHSRGRAVVIMDGDLQDPPEVLPRFIAKWREGVDVVYAIREKRKESWLKRTAYAGFYRVLQWMAHIDIPLDSGDFCIMDRRVVDLLIAMPERSRFLRGIRSWLGFTQVGLAYERDARHAGHTKYSFRRLVYLATDGLVSFSYLPLRLTMLAGLSVSLLSLTMAAYFVLKKLFSALNPPGFATLVVAILFLSGVQLMTIGVMGEYVARISEEVKRRPLYIARRIIRGRSPSES